MDGKDFMFGLVVDVLNEVGSKCVTIRRLFLHKDGSGWKNKQVEEMCVMIVGTKPKSEFEVSEQMCLLKQMKVAQHSWLNVKPRWWKQWYDGFECV